MENVGKRPFQDMLLNDPERRPGGPWGRMGMGDTEASRQSRVPDQELLGRVV